MEGKKDHFLGGIFCGISSILFCSWEYYQLFNGKKEERLKGVTGPAASTARDCKCLSPPPL